MTIVETRRAAVEELDQRVFLRGITWAQYEALLAMRGESAVPRITYLRGVAELMSPSRPHEKVKTNLARLLEAYAMERDLNFEGYGSWTLKNEPEERGAEADERYILVAEGDDAEAKDRPDLAIEVVWTSGGLDTLEAYRGLGVGEVWFWRKGRIAVFVLAAGAYREVERSALLPDVDLQLLARLAAPGKNQREAVRELRASLRRA